MVSFLLGEPILDGVDVSVKVLGDLPDRFAGGLHCFCFADLAAVIPLAASGATEFAVAAPETSLRGDHHLHPADLARPKLDAGFGNASKLQPEGACKTFRFDDDRVM